MPFRVSDPDMFCPDPKFEKKQDPDPKSWSVAAKKNNADPAAWLVVKVSHVVGNWSRI